MDAAALYRLIDEGEHQQQDFKYEISDIGKIARSLSAFANTDGGRLLVGVKDNGRIAGVRTDEEYYMLEAAATSYCRPEVSLSMQVVCVQGRSVLVAEVMRSSHRPVYVCGPDGTRRAYVRVFDENIAATPVHLDLWRETDAVCGALMRFSDDEQRRLRLLADGEGLTLGGFCRRSGLRRRFAARLLARWVRFGVVEMLFADRAFRFRAMR